MINERRRVRVVGAAIIADGRVLAARRGAEQVLAGLWEFPGGKIEVGESPESALRREIAEELGCTIEVGDLIETTVHIYDFATVELTTFYATLVAGNPAATEHAELRWLDPSHLPDLAWAPADVPAVRRISQSPHA
ncbi:(deoxy)nucleoside triphosphate pyrophosphohydrolase [Microbacterium sp. 8M]|uniref:(deoxy)nucleoside triphosphate pyrophosphohydrolase n=1 Tax=Microbacterium sp. 8M TaxID=2653153 RepID=UPI001915DA32|nr:(deoxy)nucleoside triphosphate pyrophosphohydrolase [Microbacterium sp. 8M]